jgi:hypothetical protein
MSDKDGNIFGSETQTTEKKETTIAIPAEVSELVGEGKKYADVPTALKALVASQSHISTIESENEKLREQVKNGKTVDDIFDVVSNQSNQSDDEGKTAPVDTDKVVTEVVNVLEQRDKKKTAADNVKSASDQLTEKMGDQDAARKALETSPLKRLCSTSTVKLKRLNPALQVLRAASIPSRWTLHVLPNRALENGGRTSVGRRVMDGTLLRHRPNSVWTMRHDLAGRDSMVNDKTTR